MKELFNRDAGLLTRARSTLTAMAALSILAAAPASAPAAPLITAGSTYTLAIIGTVTGHSNIPSVVFDGVSETYTLADYALPGGAFDGYSGPAAITVTESLEELGGGQHRITIDVLSTSDLFPVGNPPSVAREGGSVGIGRNGSPLDLNFSVSLLSAFLRYYDSNGVLLASSDFLINFGGSFSSLDPWDGYFVSASLSPGFMSMGGRDITRAEMIFTMAENAVPSDVPVPGALPLFASGLGALGFLAWRKQRQKAA